MRLTDSDTVLIFSVLRDQAYAKEAEAKMLQSIGLAKFNKDAFALLAEAEVLRALSAKVVRAQEADALQDIDNRVPA